MTKEGALYSFFNSFGIAAYEENTVPSEKEIQWPYLTYQIVTDDLDGNGVLMTIQLFYRSDSWLLINAKADEISKTISSGKRLICDDGYIMIYKSSPFAQNRAAEEKNIRAKVINITAEYITTE